MDRYRVKIRKKGLIVIPSEVRRKLDIQENSFLELVIDDNTIRLIVPKSLRDAFGVNGGRALEVAKLISASRRAEVEEEARS